MRTRIDHLLIVAGFAGALALHGQAVPAEYQKVLDILGRPGDFKANVLKVGVPRNDVPVTVEGIAVPTAFGFGGWIAFTKGGHGEDVMMGDLVLLEAEVNRVMSAVLGQGLEVTALHNHFFFEEPRMFYMHVMGHGAAARLAEQIKPALDLIGKSPRRPAASAPSRRIEGKLDAAAIAKIAGFAGEQSGSVYKITVGRDDLRVEEHGAAINARMGLNSWAAFHGSDAEAVVAGDIAMLAAELTPVLKVLRAAGFDVVAIHHHMTGSEPAVYFLHYWGKGPAATLAGVFRDALGQLGRAKSAR